MNLLRLDAALRALGIPINGVGLRDGALVVDYMTIATPAQRTQGDAVAASFDSSAGADATFAAQQEKAAATTSIDRGALQSGVSTDRLVRALALVVLDEVNVIRAAMTPALTARTAAQLIAAVKAKIQASPE